MTMETALRSRLQAASAVTNIVGASIFWTERPQRSAYPAVVLQTISDERPQHMKGLNDFRPTRVQIDCFALKRDTVVTLREAVIAAVLPEATASSVSFRRAFVNDVSDRSRNTETGFVHRDLVDITFWHDG